MLVAIYTDENDLHCRELFWRIHLKNDEILSLFFNNLETVIVLVQMLPNISSLSCWCRCYQISHRYRVGADATKYLIAILLVRMLPNISSLSCWCRCYQISHRYPVGVDATKYLIAVVLVQVLPNVASLSCWCRCYQISHRYRLL